MSKKITFFVVNNAGSPVRQTTVSKSLLFLIAAIGCVALGIFGYVMYDYYNLKKISIDATDLKAKIENQAESIRVQNKQIQVFANDINALKEKLVQLNKFENQIRIIANLEKTVDQDGVFGVGGSMPEDLDADLDVDEKHNSLLREMHEQVNQLNLASVKQKGGFEGLLKYLEKQRNLLAATPAIRPARGWITSKFGYRKSPFTGLREFHKGLDIANRKGTEIYATANGVVTFVGKKGLLGRIVVIDHGHGLSTRYAHLNKAKVTRGDTVKRGDVIAEMGNTGRSTGPHLHYEVRLNGVQVNPIKYILN